MPPLFRATLFTWVFLWPFQLIFATNLETVIQPGFTGSPLILDSLRYENSAKETLSFTRISFLLSGFALEKDSGGWTEIPNQYAWCDAERHRLQFILHDIPPATYRAIRFYFGPDEKTNHADISKIPADNPLNPNINGLHWNWQGGYIFLALEGYFRKGNEKPTGYSYHFARDPRRTPISLTAPLDLHHDATLTLDFDLGSLFNSPRPICITRDGVSTHSREEDPLADKLAANLRGSFRVRQFLSSVPAPAPPKNRRPIELPEKYTPFRFQMAATFPMPDLPMDNPLIEERVSLGEKLFQDPAFSKDNSISCLACHNPEKGFSDPRRFSIGIHGDPGTRNSMTLLNLAWKKSFFWDGRATSLRQQVLMPVQEHDEMDESLANVANKLSANSAYPPLFEKAFGSPEINPGKIALALEQFILTLTSYRSKFDLAMAGLTKLTPEEQRGFELFMTEYEPRMGQRGADCFHCHGGALFTDSQFHNNGLDASPVDPGRAKVTGRDADLGKFSTPTLRNVALTAPYMHDGRFKTLDEVIEHYNSGVQRSPTLDPNLAKHPVEGIQLSSPDKKALVAFLKALTDTNLPASFSPNQPPTKN
ncbi:MAG: cytochrome C peroxidase [Verrucomicrobia bacterium]|nr:cytochrome C peroxidase [Verrucomicrobiota bacterium]